MTKPEDPEDPLAEPVTGLRCIDIALESDPDMILAIALLERPLSRFELVAVLAGTFKDIRQRERDTVLAEVHALLDIMRE